MIAWPKIVGLEVRPVTARSLMYRSSVPVWRSSRVEPEASALFVDALRGLHLLPQ